MKSIIILIGLSLILFPHSAFSADEVSDRQSYIDTWKEVAVAQMHLHGIPASITMAQAILESGNGKSMLATKANNHFGIKCHGWDGPGVRKDDDKKNECFRKYRDGQDSFDDHSLFLKKQRYAFLFDYKITDYKAWAKGLKKAGYATDPHYAKRLITLIEDNDLRVLDRMGSIAQANTRNQGEARYEHKSDSEKAPAVIVVTHAREVRLHSNAIKYVESKSGDTIEKIAKDLDLAPWQIKKYNDLSSGYRFKDGEIVFLQPKRNKGKTNIYTAEKGQSLLDISQHTGVKLKKLEEYNSLTRSSSLESGKKIHLRKPKK